MKKGFFISFEGGEACGKSTQIELFKKYVQTLPNKEDFVFFHEPGGTPLGEEIRNLLLNYTEDAPVPKAELLLFYASRAQAVEKIVLPALESGKIIIADRFYDSSIAYQAMARNILSPNQVLQLTKMIIGDLSPDLTFYLKLPPEIAYKRKNQMSLDRIEKEGFDFYQKVSDGFDYISNIENKRFVTIDATKSIEEIHQEIVKIFEEKLKGL